MSRPLSSSRKAGVLLACLACACAGSGEAPRATADVILCEGREAKGVSARFDSLAKSASVRDNYWTTRPDATCTSVAASCAGEPCANWACRGQWSFEKAAMAFKEAELTLSIRGRSVSRGELTSNTFAKRTPLACRFEETGAAPLRNLGTRSPNAAP